jgi:hypothetical protein
MFSPCLRSSRLRASGGLLVVAAIALPRAARAQSDSSSTTPPPIEAASGSKTSPPAAAEPVASDATPNRKGYCRSHWFAVSECRDTRSPGPRVFFGAGLGVAKMNESGPFGFGTGVGSVTDAGPTWDFRAGLEVFPWLAVEARYDGMQESIHSSISPAGSLGFFMTSASLTVRLTLPLPYVHPYVFGGVGYYDISLTGSSGAKSGSVFNSSSQPGLPLGFGLDVPLTWHLSVAAEATYHFQLGESYSSDTANGIDGGDISTFTAVLRARL